MQVDGYEFNLKKAYPGQKADLRQDTVESFAAEEDLAFGDPVKRGTDPEKQVEKGDETSFLGVALFSHTVVTDGYKEKDTVSVLTKGAVYVPVAVSVTAGETAYVTPAGTYTNVVSTNLLVGKFLTSAASNGLAVLQI